MRCRPSPIVAAMLLMCLGSPAISPAQAQVRRCITPEGQQVYTDRQCADIGAAERSAAPVPPSGAVFTGLRRRPWMCAENVEELVYQLNNALLARDVNQVAGVYHWVGMSSAGAYAVMNRLEALSKRPTLDVAAAYSNPPDPYAQGGVIEVPLRPDQDWPELPPAPQPRLIGIQVMQTNARGDATARTLFGLTRHFGCWWIRY